MFQTEMTVIRVGKSSRGVILPKMYCDTFHVEQGDKVEAKFDDKGLIKLTLKEKVKRS